jgi:hypothetical protein
LFLLQAATEAPTLLPALALEPALELKLVLLELEFPELELELGPGLVMTKLVLRLSKGRMHSQMTKF